MSLMGVWGGPCLLCPSPISPCALWCGGCKQRDSPSPSRSISVLDYPYCVVHELPELTAESLVGPPLSGQLLAPWGAPWGDHGVWGGP